MDGVLQFVSDKLLTVHGYERQEDMVGKHLFDFLDASYHEQAALKIKEMMDGHYTGVKEFKLIRKNGERFYMDINAEVLRDDSGRPVSIFFVERDVTERKQAEEALRESESRFRSYFELPLAGRAITSPEKGWVEVNEALCTMLGYTKAELIQTTWEQQTHPDDIAADLAQFKRVQAGEIDGYSLEKRFLKKSGQIIHANLAVHCVRNPDRTVDYFVALIQDITERKRTEEALVESEQRYRRIVETSIEGIIS